MEIPEQTRNTRHQFNRSRGNVPRKQGTIGCAHAKANHQSTLWPVIEKSERQVRHHLGDRGQRSDSYPVDKKLPLHSLADGNDGCGMVAQNFMVSEAGCIIPAGEKQHQRQQPNSNRELTLPAELGLAAGSG